MTTSLTDRIARVTANLAIKAPCKYATTGNISLRGLGTRSGAPWTSSLTSGDRILVKSQTNAIENGIYNAAAGTWERAQDFDSSQEVVQGTRVSVLSSDGLPSVFYEVITSQPDIDVSAIDFETGYGDTDFVYNIRSSGAIGNGTFDCTQIIADSLSSYDDIYIPAGRWLVDYIQVAANKRIRTAGKATVIVQKPQTGTQRLILIQGSNVTIESFTAEGNISTDTGEQNHAVYVYANASTGTIENVTLGDIHGVDIRGDVLLVGAASGYVSTVRAGRITGDNVYRNVTSILGGADFEATSVTGSPVGLFTLDVEPESYTAANGRVKIGYVKGANVGFIGGSTTSYVDNVIIDHLELDPSFVSESMPAYSLTVSDGLQLRNCKSVKIGRFKANGFNRSAIFCVYNPGELGVEHLGIDSCEITDCAKTDTTYYSYIHGTGLADNTINIGHLKSSITGSNLRIVNNCVSGRIGRAVVEVGTGAALLRACNDMVIDSIAQTSTGATLVSCNRVRINGGSIVANTLTSYSANCDIRNIVATVTNQHVGGTSYENHLISNSTINSAYVGFGAALRDYTMPLAFGDYRLWVDSSSRLRVKSSAPTSDTDGTVVGTQV